MIPVFIADLDSTFSFRLRLGFTHFCPSSVSVENLVLEERFFCSVHPRSVNPLYVTLVRADFVWYFNHSGDLFLSFDTSVLYSYLFHGKVIV